MAKLIEITGKALSGEWGLEDESRTGIPVLRTTNFTKLGIINYGDVVTRNITKKNISEKFLRKGDIIIEKSGGSDKQPVGRVVLFNGEENRFLFNNFTGVLRVKDREKWVPDYVFYALFANYRNGGTRKYENKTTGLHNLKTDLYINNYEIEWINIAEQKNVCATLRKIESIISDMNKEIDYLDELIKARFVEMFENDNMNEKTIEDVASFCSRGRSPKYVTKSKLKVINQACIYWDRFKFENVKYNEEDYDGDRIISNNDLLICSTGTGTLGRCNIFRAPDDSRYMTDSHITIIRLNGHILPEVFKAWFERPRTQEKLYSDCVSGSTNQIELSKEKLKNMNILVPPINLQKQFASFVKQVDKSKFTLSNELAMCNFYVRLINDSITHSRIDLRMSE